jgi:hypothetical protein
MAMAEKTGNTDMREVLATIVAAYYGDTKAQTQLQEAFSRGDIPRSIYHLSNPSEFWAVNATDLIGKRASQRGWVNAARTWVSDLIEQVKKMFGLTNNSAVIAGLKAVLEAESGIIRGAMLSADTKDFMVFTGVGARDYDISAYRQAEALEASGVSSGPTGETRKLTGWFRGPDNLWRFEIDDRDMAFKPDGMQKTGNAQPVRLADLIEHPTLFKMYPMLEDITVVFEKLSSGGYWDRTQNRIVVGLSTSRSLDQYLGIILHEVQHAVQYWEAFNNGASPEDYPISTAAIDKTLAFLDSNKGQLLKMGGKEYTPAEINFMG